MLIFLQCSISLCVVVQITITTVTTGVAECKVEVADPGDPGTAVLLDQTEVMKIMIAEITRTRDSRLNAHALCLTKIWVKEVRVV